MQRRGCGFSSLCAALLLWVCAFACPAQSQPDRQVQLAIAEGSLISVLEQFSRQTGLQVITQLNVEDSKTEQLGSFTGAATADQALTQLLRETDLAYKWQGSETIILYLKVVPRAEVSISEVLVTGTRLAGRAQLTPVGLYGYENIHQSSVASAADFSRNLTQQPFAFSAGTLQNGAQFAQLRGLGVDTALVLINGRRVPPSANSVSQNGVDLNHIPLTAVERIEVLPDAASGIYGADAIGGVVNIILKDSIDEPELSLHYGQAEGGGTQRRAAVSVGTANDCLKSSLVLDFFDTGALMGAERGLSSARTVVPLGIIQQSLPADLVAIDGTSQLPSSEWSIIPSSRRVSAYGSAECSRVGGFSVFAEGLAEQSKVAVLRGPPAVSRQLVPASNPFNPFGVPVAVDYSFTGMDPISQHHDSRLLRLVGGARGNFNQWEWEIAGLHHAEDGTTTTAGDIDRLRLVRAIHSSDPATAVDLFGEGSPATDELMASLLSPPRQTSVSLANSQLTAFVRGPAFELDERTAHLVVGGEWRREAARFFGSGTHLDERRDIASLFSELTIPLLDKLSFNIATRADDHGENARMINSRYGLVWRPTEQWLFRASHGTGFRPASLFELYMPTLRSDLLIADPLRGGEIAIVNVINGGNPDLKTVRARSFTAGFVFTPSELPGLRVGASHWRIVMDNRIMAPIYPELLKPDSPFADRVTRDPPNSQDRQMGVPGRVSSIDLTRLNYGSLETSGIDFDTSFAVTNRWGSLQLDLAATWVDEYLNRDMNQVLPLERVGIANVQGTIPEWRVVGNVSWKLGELGVSTTATFVPSYRDADWWRGALDRRIGSQTRVDLQTWVEFSERALLDDLTLTLGARNLFDEQPEFAHASGSLGYDYSLSELTGRFVYFRVGRRF